MRLQAALVGRLDAHMRDELRRGERAATNGVRLASDGLKAELRAQTISGGLGPRLARTWRSQAYPRSGESLGAAALVWSKAPDVMWAFEDGALIKPSAGKFLAIPTKAAPKRGVGGGRINPTNFPEHVYGRLRLIYRRGAPSLLVVDDQRARTGKRGGFARAGKRAIAAGRTTTVIMFVLLPQTRLKKRLDVKGAGERWVGRLPALIVKEWEAAPIDAALSGGRR